MARTRRRNILPGFGISAGLTLGYLSLLVLIPLSVVFVVFAVANRREVTVSFDPFSVTDPSISATLPLG